MIWTGCKETERNVLSTMPLCDLRTLHKENSKHFIIYTTSKNTKLDIQIHTMCHVYKYGKQTVYYKMERSAKIIQNLTNIQTYAHKWFQLLKMVLHPRFLFLHNTNDSTYRKFMFGILITTLSILI